MQGQKIRSTECVHAGVAPCDTSASLTTPIVHCAPFPFDSTRAILDYFEGNAARHQPEYGRMGNPTVLSVERRLAALEGAEKAQLFGSGMTAVIATFLTYLKSGDHLIITSDSYKRTRTFCERVLGKFRVELSIVPPALDAIEAALRPNTRLVFTETPSNPFLYVVDIEGLARLGRDLGVRTIVDSTFATPLNLRPLDHGIDLVAHSATKYLGGHNDLIAGVLAGREDVVQPVSDFLMTLGGICDPNTAFLLERGIKTLALRVARHNANGQAVAEYLQQHPKVRRVHYPGLSSHPHHDLARRLMAGFGGVVTFELDADRDGTARFVDSLKIPKLAPSLGGVESLVEQVAIMAYWGVSEEEVERAGVTDSLARLSLGIEETDDIIADLEQALDRT
jgi:cystathionine gamma-synthase